MDDLLNINSAKTMARFISVCFLVIHVALCVLFWKTGVTPMAIFNVGSVIFYVLSLALINKRYLALWTDLVYLEVVAHMVCAALLCGWDSDFQTAILAVSSLTFFSEYVCRCLNIDYAHGLPLCVFGAVAYLVTCAVCALRPAPYTLPDSASLLLKPVLGIIVFSVLIAFLRAFAVEATRSQKALTDRMSHDKLTGLPNRYYAAEYLDEIFKGNDPGRYWLAIADIDDFEVVNDTYGHNCGDLVLSTIASLLDNNLGRTLVCRW